MISCWSCRIDSQQMDSCQIKLTLRHLSQIRFSATRALRRFLENPIRIRFQWMLSIMQCCYLLMENQFHFMCPSLRIIPRTKKARLPHSDLTSTILPVVAIQPISPSLRSMSKLCTLKSLLLEVKTVQTWLKLSRKSRIFKQKSSKTNWKQKTEMNQLSRINCK